MKSTIVRTMILCLVFASAVGVTTALAQPDREVRTKQGELKKEYNDLQEKNQLIKQTAKDKPLPTTGRRRGNIATGYDFTQVKGFSLRPLALQERIDKVFKRANELGLLEEEYHLNGPSTVPCPNGQGGASVNRVEVYVVEATPEEMESEGINPYDMIELRVVKVETCPEPQQGDEEDDETTRRTRTRGQSTSTKQYILSGMDLWTAIKTEDETLYDDVLARRVNEEPLPQPAFTAEKRGPFIVMHNHELETATSRFSDFWNIKDTLRTNQVPMTTEAAGPFFKAEVPILLDESQAGRVRIVNPNNDPMQITKIEFVGPYAESFKLGTMTPLMLDSKAAPGGKQDIKFDYIGSSPYETATQLLVQSQNGTFAQTIDIVANPGRQPADFVVFDLSLDKIELRSPSRSSFAPDWKLSYAMGNPEIGLPRWSSGMSTLSVGYKHQMSVGIVMPMNMTADGVPTPLSYDNSFLYSPMGYNIAFDFTFGFPFSLGGSLTFSDRFDGVDKYHNMKLVSAKTEDMTYKDNFFNISTAAVVYYPIMFKDRIFDPGMLVRLNVGGGFQRVERNYFSSVTGNVPWIYGTTKNVEKNKLYWVEREKDIFDVFIRIDFINTGAKNNYGLGLQYFSGRLMTDAWLELTEWLRVEAKYSFLLRGKEIWEADNSLFVITPRIRLGIPSLFK